MCGWRPVGVEAASDVSEGLAGCVLPADALGDLSWELRRATGRLRPRTRTCESASLDGEPFKLVDRDETRSPGELDDLDVREQARQSRPADPERLGCLGARVRETLDLGRPADDRRSSLGKLEGLRWDGWRWRRGVPLRLRLLAAESAARDVQSIQK